jgi:hypothetical protein
MEKRKPPADPEVSALSEEEVRLRKALEELPAFLKQGGEMAVLIMETITRSRQNKPDPRLRPVLAVIFDAYISRLEQGLEKWNPILNDVGAQIKIWDELMELQGWINQKPEKWEKWTQDHDDSAGNVLVKDYGKSYSEAKRLIRKSLERRGGRPGTSRLPAVNGLELKLLHPSLRWVDIRDRICDCGQQTHGHSCLSRLKSAVTQLKAMLRRFGLKVVITPPNDRE